MTNIIETNKCSVFVKTGSIYVWGDCGEQLCHFFKVFDGPAHLDNGKYLISYGANHLPGFEFDVAVIDDFGNLVVVR